MVTSAAVGLALPDPAHGAATELFQPLCYYAAAAGGDRPRASADGARQSPGRSGGSGSVAAGICDPKAAVEMNHETHETRENKGCK